MIPARDALALLREGNRRFVSDVSSRDSFEGRVRRIELAAGQAPFAAILGCSDSRVPVEIVFDQGLGDLFVIRVAGNIVAPSQSAVWNSRPSSLVRAWWWYWDTRVAARSKTTLEQLRRPVENQSRNLHSIVDLVRPAVEGLLASDFQHDHQGLVHAGGSRQHPRIRENLRHGSDIIENLIQNAGLRVVGAEYSLETGVVDFFDDGLDAG